MAGVADPCAHGRARSLLRRRLALLPLALLAFALLFAPARAGADTFSPGDLAKAHEKLEGLSNCTQCHVKGGQLSEERCLACHTEIKARVEAGKGFHGKLGPVDRTCNSCHKDHQGRDFQLIDWGTAGKAKFDHRKTGFPLVGKHKGPDCAACHKPALLEDPAIQSLLAKSPKRATLLGTASRCSSCHFDEHRGQLGSDCKACHDENGFKPAGGFSHARSAFPLTGKHAEVACSKCHASEPDKTTAAGLFPAPHAMEVQRFKPVAHQSCTACHKDPHEAKFGSDCTSCHSTSSWSEIHTGAAASTPAGERTLHDKTNFPLRGAHAQVACKSCHGPFGAQKARFRGLPFQRCSDCHADAHEGQLGPAGSAQAECSRCHDVAAFVGARFELEEHAKSRWPLEGAHRTVACVACHPHEPAVGKRFPAAIAKELRAHGRPVVLSLALLKPRGDPQRCESCHADAHAGQFDERVQREGCSGCHDNGSFHTLHFDHAKESRFALEGKHAQLSCPACHAREPALARVPPGSALAAVASPVRFKPIEVACATCHRDPHAGQFAQSGATDCARCHGAAAWKPTAFVHAPPFTDFLLEGRHQPLACEACHLEVALPDGRKARRYRPLPRSCEGCHGDVHDGAMKRFSR